MNNSGVAPKGDDTSDLFIGSIYGMIPLDGKIDEVKIYNYALTEEQVKNDYNFGAVRFGN